MAFILLFLAFGWLVSPWARADGCFVFKWNKAIDINEPTQKAIIVHDAGREDLLLQVKYEGPLEEFGWLIPVPSLPEVEKGSMEPFYELSELTQRRFGTRNTLGTAGMEASSRGASPEVKVVEIKTVGTYEVAILSATDSGALARWLKAHDYSLPEGKSDIVDDYIRRGWYFIAAKIELNKGRAFKTVSATAPKDAEAPTKARATLKKQLSSGELHPLLISFDTPKCVFPLKISAVGGKPSEVSLYVLSAQPLLEKFTFGKACEKLGRSHAEWTLQRPQRVDMRTRMMQNNHQSRMAAMMYAQSNRDRPPGSPSRHRNWSNEDLEALAKESVFRFPEENLNDVFWAAADDLLHHLHLESGNIPRCAKAIPRLKGKDWHLTKVAWTFSPAEMQDLEFAPAIPALAPIVSEDYGSVAAQLLVQLGDGAMPTLLTACKSRNPTERLNSVCAFEYRSRSIPPDVLITLLKDESPRVRLHAARCADLKWDKRLVDPLIALLHDPHIEIRQEASGCLSSHENRNRTSFYLGLLKDPDPKVRACSLGVASGINRTESSDDVFRAALQMLKDPDEDVQSAAVGVLLRSPQPVPIPYLLPLLNHPNPDTAAFVANLLRGGGRIHYVGDSSPPASAAEVAPLMTNRLGNARLIGLSAMQKLADATAVELTLPLLRDTNSVIRSRAFATMQAISGKSISEDDPAKWEAWWAANKASFTSHPAPQ